MCFVGCSSEVVDLEDIDPSLAENTIVIEEPEVPYFLFPNGDGHYCIGCEFSSLINGKLIHPIAVEGLEPRDIYVGELVWNEPVLPQSFSIGE